MEDIRLFEPAFKFPFPRGIEIVMRMLFIVTFVFLIDYIGLMNFGIDFTNQRLLLSRAIILSLCFYIYKLLVNRTVANKVVVNNDERTFTVHYSSLYFISKKKRIKYEDISFWFHELQSLYLGSAKAIFIYEKDKFRLKINARNGWKKKQVEEIIKELLVITDGKMRRKPKGVPDEEL